MTVKLKEMIMPPKSEADTALDWLVGVGLPKVFEKHFKLQATVGGVHQSPYTAFAMAVCEEMKIMADDGAPVSKAVVTEIGKRHGLKQEEDDHAAEI